MSFNNSLKVLLADDDADDRFLFKDATQGLPSKIDLRMVKDGEELMRVLNNMDNELPDILFLDLNMPLMSGFECLTEIRASQRLRNLYVAIYSTTRHDVQIKKAMDMGANVFINKPDSFTELKNILARVLQPDYLKQQVSEV